jgi:hypothetical protein
MSVFVFVLDGVMRYNAAINVPGAEMYRSLSAHNRVAILCGENKEEAEHFLRVNDFRTHAYVIEEDPTSSPTKEGRRRDQISRLRQYGSHVELVLEPDPEIAADLFSWGVPTMVYLHPQYSRPSFRPDFGREVKPWDTLVETIDYQTEMRTKDSRLAFSEED